MGILSLKRKISDSIRWKISVLGAVVLIIASGFIIGYAAVSVHSVAISTALIEQASIAQNSSSSFSSDIRRDLSIVQALADGYSGIKRGNGSLSRKSRLSQ